MVTSITELQKTDRLRSPPDMMDTERGLVSPDSYTHDQAVEDEAKEFSCD